MEKLDTGTLVRFMVIIQVRGDESLDGSGGLGMESRRWVQERFWRLNRKIW